MVNDSVQKKDPRAPFILSTAPLESRFGMTSQQPARKIQRGGGGGVPSRGVVPPLGNVSVSFPAGLQTNMPLTLAADVEYSATSMSSTTSFSTCARHRAQFAASRYSQFPLQASAHASSLRTTSMLTKPQALPLKPQAHELHQHFHCDNLRTSRNTTSSRIPNNANYNRLNSRQRT